MGMEGGMPQHEQGAEEMEVMAEIDTLESQGEELQALAAEAPEGGWSSKVAGKVEGIANFIKQSTFAPLIAAAVTMEVGILSQTEVGNGDPMTGTKIAMGILMVEAARRLLTKLLRDDKEEAGV